MTGGPTLVVEDLRTHYDTRAGVLKAVDGVSFEVRPGRILGMVGESGSGKTVTGFSIVGLVQAPGRIVGGRILFGGRDLVGLPQAELRKIRGSKIAMIFQDPMMTLNPVLRIDRQMTEDMPLAGTYSKAQVRNRMWLMGSSVLMASSLYSFLAAMRISPVSGREIHRGQPRVRDGQRALARALAEMEVQLAAARLAPG